MDYMEAKAIKRAIEVMGEEGPIRIGQLQEALPAELRDYAGAALGALVASTGVTFCGGKWTPCLPSRPDLYTQVTAAWTEALATGNVDSEEAKHAELTERVYELLVEKGVSSMRTLTRRLGESQRERLPAVLEDMRHQNGLVVHPGGRLEMFVFDEVADPEEEGWMPVPVGTSDEARHVGAKVLALLDTWGDQTRRELRQRLSTAARTHLSDALTHLEARGQVVLNAKMVRLR